MWPALIWSGILFIQLVVISVILVKEDSIFDDP